MVWGSLKKGKMSLIFLGNKVVIFILYKKHTGRVRDMENIVRSQWGFECIVAGQDSGSKEAAVLFKNNIVL